MTTERSGVEVARAAIRAIANDDEAQALELLNAATPEETAHAAAYLLSALREATATYAKHHNARRRKNDRHVSPRSLLMGAAEDHEDVLMAEVQGILEAAMRGDSDV